MIAADRCFRCLFHPFLLCMCFNLSHRHSQEIRHPSSGLLNRFPPPNHHFLPHLQHFSSDFTIFTCLDDLHLLPLCHEQFFSASKIVSMTASAAVVNILWETFFFKQNIDKVKKRKRKWWKGIVMAIRHGKILLRQQDAMIMISRRSEKARQVMNWKPFGQQKCGFDEWQFLDFEKIFYLEWIYKFWW